MFGGSRESGGERSPRSIGLRNGWGEQNCFINVVIQALWRLRACRDFFLSESSEPPMSIRSTGRGILLDALRCLYSEYKFTDESILPPDQVRVALANAFADMDRFQLGEMDDAGESLDSILALMHGPDDLDAPCKSREHCLGHQVFSLELLRVDRCKKCLFSKTESEKVFSYQVYTQELLDILRGSDRGNLDKEIKAARLSHATPCPSCHTQESVMTCLTLLSAPSVLSLSLVWPHMQTEPAVLEKILRLIAQSSKSGFAIDEAFDILEQEASLPLYDLAGMICFYPGRHYVYFGRSGREGWILFDDHEVKPVGDFDAVILRCVRAKYHPVALFYEQSARPPKILDKHSKERQIRSGSQRLSVDLPSLRSRNDARNGDTSSRRTYDTDRLVHEEEDMDYDGFKRARTPSPTVSQWPDLSSQTYEIDVNDPHARFLRPRSQPRQVQEQFRQNPRGSSDTAHSNRNSEAMDERLDSFDEHVVKVRVNNEPSPSRSEQPALAQLGFQILRPIFGNSGEPTSSSSQSTGTGVTRRRG